MNLYTVEYRAACGAVVITVTSQQVGTEFKSVVFLCGVCMLSHHVCVGFFWVCRFLPQPKHMHINWLIQIAL